MLPSSVHLPSLRPTGCFPQYPVHRLVVGLSPLDVPPCISFYYRSSSLRYMAASPGGACIQVRTQRGAYCSSVWVDTLLNGSRLRSRAIVTPGLWRIHSRAFSTHGARLQAVEVVCRRHLSGFRIDDSLSRYRAVDLPCFRPVALLFYRFEKR